ncbi:MAG: GNAT family N-acetyltransferase [Candidatus Hodarchaeota archaeon]
MIDDLIIRQATVDDISDLVRLRRMMFEAMGFDNPLQLDAADSSAKVYFEKAIPSGEFHGWLAITADGDTVASGGAVIDQHPPGPGNLSGQIGYIMNLATEPAYQRQGIARRIMRAIIAWLADQGIQLIALHATEPGRPLYLELGFADTNEMRLILG